MASNTKTFTLETSSWTIENVSEQFMDSCMVFSNMFEDTGNKDPNEKIPITNSFEKEDVENYIDLFNKLSNLKVTNNDRVEKSYLKYITEDRLEYIENYLNLNLNPPHCKELIEILKSLFDTSVEDEENDDHQHEDHNSQNDYQEQLDNKEEKSQQKLEKILEIDGFFDNKDLRAGIMLLFVAFVRSNEVYGHEQNSEEYKKIEKEIDSVIKAIMDNVD